MLLDIPVCQHLRSFQEAVNNNGNFAAEKEVSVDRLLHTKYLLNIFFERMIHVVEYYSDVYPLLIANLRMQKQNAWETPT